MQNYGLADKLLSNVKKPTRVREITYSEIIILLHHQSRCQDFKSFYLHYLKLLYKNEFSKLPSHDRFLVLKSRVLWCYCYIRTSEEYRNCLHRLNFYCHLSYKKNFEKQKPPFKGERRDKKR